MNNVTRVKYEWSYRCEQELNALITQYKAEEWRTPARSYFCTKECKSVRTSIKKPGYDIHHIKEDTIPDLSRKSIARAFYWEWQQAKSLVYLTKGEHFYIHTLICIKNGHIYTPGNIELLKSCVLQGDSKDKEIASKGADLMQQYIDAVEAADQQDKAEEEARKAAIEAVALQRKAKKEARKAAENQIKGTVYKVNKDGRISIFKDIATMLSNFPRKLRRLVCHRFRQGVNKVKYKNIVVTRSEK